MNKLYNLKNNQSNNFNVLSSTSSEFISHINLNKNLLFSKGGSNHTIEAFNAFNDNNLDLALYILNNNNFNCNTQDVNGNTILHHLVYNSKDNEKCITLINRILEFPNIENIINLQNKYGQTPILVAVLNENDKVIYDRLLVNIGSFHWFFDYPKLINICNDMYKINEIGNTNLRNIILHILLLTILSMCIIFPQPSFAIIKALIYLLSITMKGGFVFTSFLSKNIGDFYSLCKKNLPKEYSSKLSSFIKEAFGSREKIFNMRLR